MLDWVVLHIHLKLPYYFVLPIANPFLSCPVGFYINRSSNERSLLIKEPLIVLLSYKKPISVAPDSRRKPIALATASVICLNWAVTCRIRGEPHRSIKRGFQDIQSFPDVTITQMCDSIICYRSFLFVLSVLFIS